MITKFLYPVNDKADFIEDWPALLNHSWTATVLLMLGIVITLVQYVGSPMECWCPAELTDAQCNYTKAMCWIRPNYHKLEHEVIEPNEEDRYGNQISYYPWIPWLLLAMAASLEIPSILWQNCSKYSGLDMAHLISTASSEDRKQVSSLIKVWLFRTKRHQNDIFEKMKKWLGAFGFFWMGRHHTTYFCGLLIFVKFAYLLVTILLYTAMIVVMGADIKTYGSDAIYHYFYGTSLPPILFPTQTICDIRIRQMTNVNTFSMQCVLPVNIFNEKIFIFLSLWLPFLMAVNAFSFVQWVCNLLLPSRLWQFVRSHVSTLYKLQEGNFVKLRKGNGTELEDDVAIETEAIDFIPESRQSSEDRKRQINRDTKRMLNYFGHDGVVVFRLLENGLGSVIANEIFHELYELVNNKHIR